MRGFFCSLHFKYKVPIWAAIKRPLAFLMFGGKQQQNHPKPASSKSRLCKFRWHISMHAVHSARKFTPFSQREVLFHAFPIRKRWTGDAIYCGRGSYSWRSWKTVFSTIRNRVRRRPAITLWEVVPDDSPANDSPAIRPGLDSELPLHKIVNDDTRVKSPSHKLLICLKVSRRWLRYCCKAVK